MSKEIAFFNGRTIFRVLGESLGKAMYASEDSPILALEKDNIFVLGESLRKAMCVSQDSPTLAQVIVIPFSVPGESPFSGTRLHQGAEVEFRGSIML